MQTKIQKWGNSLGLRIPKLFAGDTGVRDGSIVEITIKNGQLIVNPVRRKKCNLNDLVSKITSSNIHDEIDWGDPVGREVW